MKRTSMNQLSLATELSHDEIFKKKLTLIFTNLLEVLLSIADNPEASVAKNIEVWTKQVESHAIATIVQRFAVPMNNKEYS